MNKLKICKQTRQIAAESLYKTLEKLLKSKEPISEARFRDAWLSEMRKHKEIFPDGWYLPPPHGIGVLFATDKNFSRIKFKTLRAKEYWPKEDIFLDRKNGFAFFYSSLVDKSTFIIGDFGLNIYFGNNKQIQTSLCKHLKLVKGIFDYSSIGMELSGVNSFAKNIFERNGFTNDWWVSTTDLTGTNYGHTIPGTEIPWTIEEAKALKETKNWEDKIKIINKKRKFINAKETIIINEGMGLTIEPRVLKKDDSSFPNIYFHTIALFYENGEKEWLTNFDKIFELTGMDYMPKHL